MFVQIVTLIWDTCLNLLLVRISGIQLKIVASITGLFLLSTAIVSDFKFIGVNNAELYI